jgi:NADH-quinone oxidoreductase subunit E
MELLYFALFCLKPKEKNIIKLCDGTACHVKKSTVIIDANKKEVRLKGKRKYRKRQCFYN